MNALALLLLCACAARASLFGPSATLDATRKLYDAGRYQDVVSALNGDEKLERLSSKDQRVAYYYLGMSYERTGRSDRAVGVYQLGVSLFPKDVNLLTRLAEVLHQAGLEQQAAPVFRTILEIHPNNAAAHLGLAEIDQALGFYDRSAEHFQKALRDELGGNPEVWREYGELLLKWNRPEPAQAALLKSLALKEGVDARADLAAAQRAQGRLQDALDTLTKAVSAQPDRLDLLSARALWLLEAGRFDLALSDAETLLRADDPPALAYWVRARVYLHEDRYGPAVDDLKELATMDREAPFSAKAARELLDQLGAR